MIKFFRKIRYDLIEKNPPASRAGKTGTPALPTGRYFKYAIGEIILVVVGILIALQINNWNNYKINRSESNEFNERLLSEVNGNLELGNKKMAEIQSMLNSSKGILDLFNEPLNEINSKSLDSLIYIVIGGVKVEYVTGTLNEGLNTGKVALIESDILKSKLYGLPSNIEYVREYDNLQNDFGNKYLQPFLYKNFNYRTMDNAFSGYDVGESNFKTQHDKALLENEEFENLIDNRFFASSTQLIKHENLKKEFEEIKKLIEVELNSEK